jgi:hypothetical protein
LALHGENFATPLITSFFAYVSARVVTDHASGYSKGFGFVRYSTLEDAEKGMKGMDAQVCIP